MQALRRCVGFSVIWPDGGTSKGSADFRLCDGGWYVRQ
jgi:hypothetical protein